MVRGMNEPSAYYHPGRDLLMVLYTDDQLLDGYREDIEWYYSLLRARFKIKEPRWLSPDNPIDHLGVRAMIRTGPPLPPAIFIGRATTNAPVAGTASSAATFSITGMLAPQST